MHLSPTSRERVLNLAARICKEEPRLDQKAAFGASVTSGLGPWPALVIEDHSSISLFETEGNLAYSYRALLLASAGDLVVVAAPSSKAFEDYCAGSLGLGRPEVLVLKPSNNVLSLAEMAAADAPLFERLVERAGDAGGLGIVTYMGSADVWQLAGRISHAARVPVKVAAAPPALTRRVNDKLWFAKCVADLLGQQALPATAGAYGLATLVGRIIEMEDTHESLAIKLTRSASSAGNYLLDLKRIKGMSARGLYAWLEERFHALGWSGRFPVIVTSWERPVLSSPSVQLWLPERKHGPPIVEGIFDQIIVGDTAVFSGAEPSRLSEHLQQRLANEAAHIGLLFQYLGYFGRCSFDSILVGQSLDTAELLWVECNGRWGGVSIPMTLANRLLGDWRKVWPVVVEGYSMARPPRGLNSILSDLSGELYDSTYQSEGAVILSPGRLEAAQGYEFLVLDRTREAALARAARVSTKLQGTGSA